MSDNKTEKSLGDLIRKIADQGLKNTILNEENLREILKEVPLPKAVVAGFVGQLKNSRDDIVQLVREEVKKYLKGLDTNRMIDYVLKNYEVDIQASLKFRKKAAKSSKNSSKSNG